MAKRALGKGLSALISEETKSSMKQGYIPALPIEYIYPNPFQPRIEIKPDSLVEMSDSIREHGVIQPLIVTKKDDKHYELIAGERRLRATKLAGLVHAPVVVKEASHQEMLELAIVENVQRRDLNPLEEALAFEQLVNLYDLTHDNVAKKMGISRPAVANKIRLLSLPEDIKKGLLEAKISEGHARALLGLEKKDTMIAAYKVILRDHLSVRAVEELVRRLNKGQKKQPRKDLRIVDEKTSKIENSLQQRFGKGVNLSRSKKGGKIVIPFKSDQELNKLVSELLT